MHPQSTILLFPFSLTQVLLDYVEFPSIKETFSKNSC